MVGRQTDLCVSHSRIKVQHCSQKEQPIEPAVAVSFGISQVPFRFRAKFKGWMPSFPLILRSPSRKILRCSSFPPKLSLSVNRRTLYSLGILAASVAVGVRHGRPFVPQRILSGTHKAYYYSNTCFTSLRHLAFGSCRHLFLSTSFDMSHISTLKPPQEPLKWTHTPEQVIPLTKEKIDEDRKFLDKIGALPEKECNFESVSGPLCLRY
jgi:hypothetical protein